MIQPAMITEKELKYYGLETLEEYYDYIIYSRINGQHKQSRMLFWNLGDDGMQGQRAGFFDYVEACGGIVIQWKEYLGIQTNL